MSADAAWDGTPRRWVIGADLGGDDEVVLSWSDAGPTLLCRRRTCRRDGVPWEAELPPNCTPEDAVLFANGHRSTHQ